MTSPGALTLFAHGANGHIAVALGETPARRVGQKPVVGILRRSVAQQLLQQDLHVGGGQHVLAARHQGHALEVIVDGDREVIAGRRVLPRDHEVAHQQRLALDTAARLVVKGVRPGLFRRTRGVEPQADTRGRPRHVRAAPAPTEAGTCPDRAVRRDHAVRWPTPRPRARSRRGCRSRDRSGRAGRAGPAPCRRSAK